MENSELHSNTNIDWKKFYIETESSRAEFFFEITKAIKSTLGPSGMEKFLQKKNGRNDYN